MNVPFIACATACLIVCTSSVQAASSIDLSVTGTITPSACTPSLSGSGRVDYGKIPAKDLSVDRPTELPEATLKLSVNCDAETLFALHGRDNRRGSSIYSSLSEYYGLGLINGDQKLGAYRIGVYNPVADTAVYPLFSFDYGKTWLVNSSGSFMGHEYWNAFGLTPTPIALKNVTVDLRIATDIAPAKTLTLTEEVPLDGSTTLDVVYL
ncbi:DUF1120 domain-containing protein [Pseudomonas nabeulensis]|uniref:DUF1120 domain-containing protein n=1 Tax=Pseudomonas nabeulensis TaxID=2293833 RepID=A0A4Z0AUR8_9PSED|nr:DUF1120 domain-containing protein [Pseudomonas nabeulensis]TFY90180.1 DUF1120 domain-containing protein [Pseudomonas nabeulensis]